jgi:calcineurin-like phosphoesterase family protein
MRDFNNTLIQGPPIIRIDEADIPYVLCTSDLHLKHKNILYYTKRLNIPGIKDVETMEDIFVKNINDAINMIPANKRHKAMMINCGDFIFASGQNSFDYYIDFRKKLTPIHWYNVSGNHDNNNLYRTTKFTLAPTNVPYGKEEIKGSTDPYYITVPAWYWSSMYIMEIYRGAQVICVLTISHYPQEDFLGSVNIHGHLHTYEDLTDFKGSDKEWAIRLKNDGHYMDVGVDRNYGKPVWLSDILEGKYDVKVNKIPQLQSLKWRYNIDFR